MATEIVIPRLGWSMEHGVFLGWLRAAGESIEIGQPLFSLEGEKAVEEIVAVDRGVLWIGPDAPSEKMQVAVGQVIGYLLAVGEAPPAVTPRSATPAPTQAATTTPATASAASVSAAATAAFNKPASSFAGELAGSPSARRRARRAAAGLATAVVASTIPETSALALNGTGRVRSTPRARRAAQKRGTQLHGLQGTGRGGRIRERDVLAAQSDHAIVAQLAEAAPAASLLRRTIARRMHESLDKTAPVTLMTTADATELVRLRKQFQTAGTGPVPSYTDFFVKLVALALEQHPELCQRRPEAPPLPPGFHLGIAVDTPSGLLVPVIRNVERLALRQLAETSARLIAKARTGGLGMQELQGACFTVTNLGAYGIDAFTPIINYPEAAILGLGCIRTEPVYVNEGRIEPRDRMALSLTFDHALLDGAPAARFLQTLCKYVATPAAVLL